MDWKPEIDIHCHILPNWDDGPETIEISLAMCARAASVGLKTIVATPHIGRSFGNKEHSSEDIAGGVQLLQKEINAQGIPINIVTGGEILMGAIDLHARLPQDLTLTYGAKGKFALIESPYPSWPDFGPQLINLMQNKGVTPILAHPERYLNVQKTPNILEPLVRQNALLQVTAGAITGEMGKLNRACVRALLKQGWVSFISSDAHNTSHALPHQAIEEVVKLIGEDAARTIFFENPRKMLNGERVSPGVPDEEITESVGFFKKLFKR
jgi:protein-tyrosine phosphatase